MSSSLLLVGYGWFAGIPEGETNNAELVARALDGEVLQRDGRSAVVHSLIVPVRWADAFGPVEAAIARLRPTAVVAMGTDARAAALRPEPYAVNWAAGQDAGDAPPRSEPIAPGGSAWLRGTLPYEAMVREALAAGIPAQLGALRADCPDAPIGVSCTAGTYLCNFMAYRLAQLGHATGLRAGFIHLPTQPAYACRRRLVALDTAAPEDAGRLMAQPLAAMPLGEIVEGVRAMLGACI